MNIFKVITGNIVKWWQLVILPVLRINNNNTQNPVRTSESAPTQPMQEVSSDAVGQEANGDGDMDALAVLNRINQEKEQALEKAKREADEKARIDAIMNANKVDVNSFIQAGKAASEVEQLKEESVEQAAPAPSDDEMRRAMEIMERLNREAAEDEAKKQAQIDEAKRQAEEQFG
ncbi:MAG: hypothetical protein Q4D51_08200 [Eubacteriales bacterium]|nr:hypothetical protein [Eubacteriales bacterium]